MGNWRNCIAVVIKFNEADKHRLKLQNVNDLRKIKYVSLGLGKEPIKTNMDPKSREKMETSQDVVFALNVELVMRGIATTESTFAKS